VASATTVALQFGRQSLSRWPWSWTPTPEPIGQRRGRRAAEARVVALEANTAAAAIELTEQRLAAERAEAEAQESVEAAQRDVRTAEAQRAAARLVADEARSESEEARRLPRHESPASRPKRRRRLLGPMSSAASCRLELRRLFPGITDNVLARECARTIAGWKPRPLKQLPKRPRVRRMSARGQSPAGSRCGRGRGCRNRRGYGGCADAAGAALRNGPHGTVALPTIRMKLLDRKTVTSPMRESPASTRRNRQR
jgi:hypothetical protein